MLRCRLGHRRRQGRCLVLILVLASAGAVAQDGDPPPLAITVNPSAYAPAPESLEQKLARRDRESDYLFRHICRNCGGRQGEAGATFDPQTALDVSRRAR